MTRATLLLRSAVCDDGTFGRFVARIKQITKMFDENTVAGIFIQESFSDSALASGFRKRLATSIETRLLSPFAVLRFILNDPEVRPYAQAETVAQIFQSGEQPRQEQLASLVYRPLSSAFRGCKLVTVATCVRLIEFANRVGLQVQVALANQGMKGDNRSQRRAVAASLLEALDALLTRFCSLIFVLHRAQMAPATGEFCEMLRALLISLQNDRSSLKRDEGALLDKRALERLESCLSALETRDASKLLPKRSQSPTNELAPLVFGSDEVRLCFSALLLSTVSDANVFRADQSVALLADRVCVLLRAGRTSSEDTNGFLAFELVRTALLLVADASSAELMGQLTDDVQERSTRLAIRLVVFIATRFGDLLAALLSRAPNLTTPANETVAECVETLVRSESHRVLRESVIRGLGVSFLVRFLGSLVRANLLRSQQHEALAAELRQGDWQEAPRLAFIDEAVQFAEGECSSLRNLFGGAQVRLTGHFLADSVRSPMRLFGFRCVLECRNELLPFTQDCVRFLASNAASTAFAESDTVEFAYAFCTALRTDDDDMWREALRQSQVDASALQDALLGNPQRNASVCDDATSRCRDALLEHVSYGAEPLTFSDLLRLASAAAPLRVLSMALYSLLHSVGDAGKQSDSDVEDLFKVKKEESDESAGAVSAFQCVVDGLRSQPSGLCAALCAHTLLQSVYSLRSRSVARATEHRTAARLLHVCASRDGEQDDALAAKDAAPCDDIFGSSLPNESTLMLLARRESVSTTALRIFLDVTEKLPAAPQPAAPGEAADVKLEPVADERKPEAASGSPAQNAEAEREADRERRLLSLAQRLVASGCLTHCHFLRRELAALDGGFSETVDSDGSAALDTLFSASLARVIANECAVFGFDTASLVSDAVTRRGTTWLARTLFDCFLCCDDRLAPARNRRTCATLLAVLVSVGCDAACVSELLRLTAVALQQCVLRANHAFTDANAEYLASFLSTLLHSAYRLAPASANAAEMNSCVADFFTTLRQLVRNVASGHVSVCHLFAKRLVHLLAEDYAGVEASEQLLAQVPLELLVDLRVIAHYELELALVLRLFHVRLRSLDQLSEQATHEKQKSELVERTLSLIEHFRLVAA